MKTFVTIFALLALFPAFAEQAAPAPAPAPAPLNLAVAFSPAPACPSVAASTVPNPGTGKLPAWLIAPESLISTAHPENPIWLSTCSEQCAGCFSCCVLVSRGNCQCC